MSFILFYVQSYEESIEFLSIFEITIVGMGIPFILVVYAYARRDLKGKPLYYYYYLLFLNQPPEQREGVKVLTIVIVNVHILIM